jgi:hypothetical protein
MVDADFDDHQRRLVRADFASRDVHVGHAQFPSR